MQLRFPTPLPRCLPHPHQETALSREVWGRVSAHRVEHLGKHRIPGADRGEGACCEQQVLTWEKTESGVFDVQNLTYRFFESDFSWMCAMSLPSPCVGGEQRDEEGIGSPALLCAEGWSVGEALSVPEGS